MGYKEILVFLDPTPDSETRVKLAVALGRAHGARLVGVDACSDAAYEGQWRERALALEETFQTALGEAGLRGAYRGADQWAGPGHPYAHYADLIIASEPAFEAEALIAAGIPEEVLTTSGVPMLLLPYGWKFRAAIDKVVIAWKAGREATRAVHDALPLLRNAKKITVFTFAPESDAFGAEQDQLVGHLKEHGVAAGAESWPGGGGMSAVEALFACLETQDADLIVAGAYGHSRLLEGLFGGVSRDLVRQPSLPVLMSH